MKTPDQLFSTPWMSRAAAVLLLLLVLTLLYLWVIAPLRMAYANSDARIVELKDLVTRIERIASERDVLRDEVARFSSQPENVTYYLTGETEAVAGAALQARLTSVIANSGGSLASVQALPGADDHGLRRIAVRVQLAGGIETLVNVLHSLETGLPLLFVSDLDIQSQSAPMMAINEPYTEPVLAVSAEIYGYLPPGTGAEGEAATP
jgi:general secretion pathway protein M